ncbi:MAG: aldehyde dehydrogenase, partial [Clostridia bacterium]|nr:aldehyde dehydrogenase [Clostridia bacterium]
EEESHRFVVYNPKNDTPYAVVQGCGAKEVDACVRAADHAFHHVWKRLSPHERGVYLKKAAQALRGQSELIARIETEEEGKPLDVSANDVRRCAEAFDFFGGLIGNLPSDLYELGAINAEIYLEPFGVVAGIVPFNWPPLHAGAKIAPALAAGNTVVIKPGDQAPLAVMKIVEIVQSVLPEHVLELIVGPGLETGIALTQHPLVRKISFTGSDNGGRAILKQSADNLTPCIMELGGKNAFIALSDCDLERAVKTAFEGAFYNCGEACTATSRILVDRSILESFTAKFIALMDRLVLGDGMDPKVNMGPMVTRAHQQKVLAYIETGKQEGAVLTRQLPVPTEGDLTDGYFVGPTLFTDVTRDMRIAREEIFGPVTCIMPFDGDEEAISIANDTDFGLIAVVFSESHTRAMRVVRALDTGSVYVNNFYRLGAQCVPFGGNKASGYGRERCAETLLEFSRPKTVRIPSGLGDIPAWKPIQD